MLKAVNSGNLSMIQKYINNKQDYFSIGHVKMLSGYSDEEGVRVEMEEQIEIFETDKMNPFELSCVRGNQESLRYLELRQKHRNFMTSDHKITRLEQL